MSVSSGFSLGERVHVLTPGTSEESRCGVVATAPAGRVSVDGHVWVQLTRPLLGRTLVHMPAERVRRDADERQERTQAAAPLFAPVLREFRDRRRISQSRLGEAAGFDHSYVSRLESGTRMPTRDAVVKLADALRLDDGDRDALLSAAGFMPGDINNLFASEPVIGEVVRVLGDRAIPADVQDDLRHMITLLVRQAQRSAVGV